MADNPVYAFTIPQDPQAEASKKLGEIRAEADKQALALLTDEQSKEFEKMKGKKFELKTPTGEGKKESEKKPATT